MSETERDRAISMKFLTSTVFALEHNCSRLYTLWGELSQNQLAKQLKQLLTKEICILSETTTYIFPHRIGQKDMKVSLFYLIHPANSNSRENSGILMRFPCFMSNYVHPLGGGHIIFAFSAVCSPPSGVPASHLVSRHFSNSSYPIFTKFGMQVYWVNSLYGIAFGDDSSIAN